MYVNCKYLDFTKKGRSLINAANQIFFVSKVLLFRLVNIPTSIQISAKGNSYFPRYIVK